DYYCSSYTITRTFIF
nr:immunoglobulin light chain junction region [Macaca mulatta]MOY05902.1 immunoglobulin light chain junction region [Macaca mulatta]MOY06213.1 immunoglobulin light chain junction region [Macaca mulatta]MOY07373.1 immunoglobulin light chain junction region [Macaca mulatta]MOY07597.1 immunoglobulin light chain junction region [Macaca mulatta]